MPWEVVIVLVLILANGFFSGAEMAIVASRRGRLSNRPGRQPTKLGRGSLARSL